MCPRLFTIGSFSLPTYGVLVATGFLTGLWLVGRLSRRAGLDPEKMTSLGFYLVLAAIIGAKGLMILTNADYYLTDLSRIFSLNALQSGGIFYGGLLAALATTIWYCRKQGLPWLETADVFAPAVAIGHSVGRLGCFAAGCCWGKPSSLPWAVAFTDPGAHEKVGVPLNIHLHPTQLYEAAGALAIGLLLLRLFHRPHARGVILGWYLALYSVFRLGVEFLRAESERAFPFGGPLSTTQWVAVGLFVAGVVLLVRQRGAAHAEAVRQPS
jgi:phosphatidylglycerol:prolipoprotein diacylglycerol transferase